MSTPPTWFRANVSAALADGAMRAATRNASAGQVEARSAEIARVDSFEALRELAARIKQYTIENLDHYLEQFVTRATAAGAHVHFAATRDDANRRIAAIARDNALALCVKSKSMTSEETQLNAALEDAGVRVVETDLGEFIVQLDRDTPSHIVMPIIHKNRAVIARAFTRELGVEYTEDPRSLAMHARRYLRDVFRRCDLGISGVNFAVAESGALCICTNEGNGRLTTTRPRVHVALMGIEKIIPRMVDLSVFLKILARSSTGQSITVYTSLISGPKRAADADGPEQLHIVLLDAGRRNIIERGFNEALRCIRCGACLNVCPVYRTIGGHAYGNVYPGPIGKVIAPLLNDAVHYAELPQASSLCGRCLEVCPVKIDIPDLLVRLRRDQVEERVAPVRRSAAFRRLLCALSAPHRLRAAQRLARILSTPWASGEWLTSLPGPLRRITKLRDIPRPAARTFRDLWRAGLGTEQRRTKES